MLFMVSIIVPVYNAEKTLLRCVQSILNQSYFNFELILIDDGSEDNSGQICDNLYNVCIEKGVSCQVIHQKNSGVSKARNNGIEHAHGSFFVCVDSDDMIENCYLEDLVKTVENHPELGHVLCGFKCMSSSKNYILTDTEPMTIVTRKDYMRLFGRTLINSPWLALYRTDIVRENNIKMREDLSLAEDLLFNLDYLDAIGEISIGVINKTNYIYQDDNPYSLNRKYRHDLRIIYESVDQSLNHYLLKWGITDQTSWRDYYRNVFYHYMEIMDNTLDKQNNSSLKEKILYNNSILRSECFQKALQKGEITSILPSQKRALESGNYIRVLVVECIQDVKRMIISFLK